MFEKYVSFLVLFNYTLLWFSSFLYSMIALKENTQLFNMVIFCRKPCFFRRDPITWYFFPRENPTEGIDHLKSRKIPLQHSNPQCRESKWNKYLSRPSKMGYQISVAKEFDKQEQWAVQRMNKRNDVKSISNDSCWGG